MEGHGSSNFGSLTGNGSVLRFPLASSFGSYFYLITTSRCVTATCILAFRLITLQSLMAQGSQFPLRKPPGFHYDFFLLGITTFIAGLIGVPAPNGLIPQAPIHTASLLIMGKPSKNDT